MKTTKIIRSVGVNSASALIMLTWFSGFAHSYQIFRSHFENGLEAPLHYVSTWQDDNDANGSFQIYAKGSEGTFPVFTVNTVADGNQINPAVGVAANGNFVVVWQDDADGNGSYQIKARGFFANGSERFPQMTVNTESDGQQLKPAIAMNPVGDFVVVWQDDQDKIGLYNILGRGFFADGTERFSDKTVANTGDGNEQDPVVAMADDGGFVVAWTDDTDGNGFQQIHTRGFDANGNSTFPRFTINSLSAGQQITPDIAMASNGDFVVTWASDANGDWFFETLARGFYADGSERFSDIAVNQFCSGCGGSRYSPAVGMEDDGRFVVAWIDRRLRLMARQFYANGDAANDEFLVNQNTKQSQNRPVVDISSQGDVIVVWDELVGTEVFNIKARRLDINGQLGPEITVSSNNNNDQLAASVGVR